MMELNQSTTFHFDILQETLRSQMQIIEGPPQTAARPRGGDNSQDASLSTGLTSLIAKLTTDHDELVQRVKRITERLELQRENAELQLALAISQRPKMTRAEQIYQRELRDWSSTIAQMSRSIEALRMLAKPAMQLAGTTPSTVDYNSGAAGAGTPIKSQAGGSSGAVRALQTPSRGHGSPAPSLSRFSYNVPGTPSSTPAQSGAGETTPTRPPLRSINEVARTGSGGGSAMKPFQSPGYNTKFLSMQSPAAFRGAATAGSAVKPQQQKQQQRQQVAAPLALSEEDQSACRELLGAQTGLLQEAEDNLRALEDRVRQIVLSRN